MLDVDSFEDLGRLEKKLGVELRGISTEVRTQRARLHIHFPWPEDADIRNSVGKAIRDGFEGLDVRGEGGLAPLPPSAGYTFSNDIPMAPAPPELVEWAVSRTRLPHHGGAADRPRVEVPDGEMVREGSRNSAIFWGAYDMHREGKSLEEAEAWALAFNEKRCDQGSTHPHTDAEALRTVRSAYRYPVRRAEQDAQAREVMERAWRRFYEEELPKSGRGKKRDSHRSLLEFGDRIGRFIEVILDGEVRRAIAVSLSSRQGAIPAATSNVTFWKCLNRLEAEEKILAQSRLSGKKLGDEQPETWLILEPVTKVNSPVISPLQERDVGGVNLRHRPEKTPCFRYRHPVGNARGGTLVAAEVHGPSTAEELAEVMGYSRVADFKRKHLKVLVERGDLVDRDGVYAIPGDYGERMEAERHASYSASKRRRVGVDPSGRLTHSVDYGPEKSDVERDAEDLARYEKQRQKLREALEKKRRFYQDPANSTDELLEVPKNLAPVVADGLISELEPAGDDPPDPDGTIRDEREVFEIMREFRAREAA